MTSAVTELARPTRFVDEQQRGPFRSFRHEHLFEQRAGRTVMVDRIEFQAPLGAVGQVVERIVLGRYLRHLIEVRNSFLKTEAEVSA